jgi:hypothetical protein
MENLKLPKPHKAEDKQKKVKIKLFLRSFVFNEKTQARMKLVTNMKSEEIEKRLMLDILSV